MAKRYPKKFRENVVLVAMRRDPGIPIRQIAADFWISEPCLQKWLRQADTGAVTGAAVGLSVGASVSRIR